MHLYIMLGLAALTVTAQNVLKKAFNERGGSPYLFSAIAAATAGLLLALTNREWVWAGELIWPTLGFSLAYAAAGAFSVLAILHGPLAKTSLIVSCSLLLPSLYGILVQGVWLQGQGLFEALSPTLLFGTVLLVVSLVLVNRQKRQTGQEKKVSLRWLLYVLLAFLGNGLCSVVQAAKQDFYGNAGNGVFMVSAMCLSAVLLLVAALFSRPPCACLRTTLMRGWHLAMLCGAANGLTNLLVISLNAAHFPTSITFPVVSGGSILLVFLYSVLVKKERYTPPQYVGYALGAVSLVLLNI